MEEVEHVIDVLRNAKEALKAEDAPRLRELSNQTIHSASIVQDSGSITLAVVIYALSKLIERSDHARLKSWKTFVNKFCSWMDLSIKALQDSKFEQYEKYLQESRKSISGLSVNMKSYIQEVLLKASINKASRIYEHGISLGKTAQLLGVSQWELSEYTAQKKVGDEIRGNLTARQRAEMALEFFS